MRRVARNRAEGWEVRDRRGIERRRRPKGNVGWFGLGVRSGGVLHGDLNIELTIRKRKVSVGEEFASDER